MTCLLLGDRQRAGEMWNREVGIEVNGANCRRGEKRRNMIDLPASRHVHHFHIIP